MVAGLFAILLGLGGGYALFDAWRRRGSVLRTAIGWAMIAGAAILCIVAGGPEFGVAYALLGLSAVGVLHVGWGMEVRVAKRSAPVRDRLPGDGADWSAALLRFVLAVPVAGVAAACVSVVVSGWLPAGAADRHAIAILGMPVLWGILAWWVLAAPRILPAGATLGGAAALAAIGVFA